MRIGFTGTQTGMTEAQKEFIPQILELKQCTEFFHGDCIGADAQAADIAVDWGCRIFTIFPPLDVKKRAFWCHSDRTDIKIGEYAEFNYRGKIINVKCMPPDSYLNRNKHIVDNVQWMIAAPKEHKHTVRSGTWQTIRYCWKIKREITIIPPIVREDE